MRFSASVILRKAHDPEIPNPSRIDPARLRRCPPKCPRGHDTIGSPIFPPFPGRVIRSCDGGNVQRRGAQERCLAGGDPQAAPRCALLPCAPTPPPFPRLRHPLLRRRRPTSPTVEPPDLPSFLPIRIAPLDPLQFGTPRDRRKALSCSMRAEDADLSFQLPPWLGSSRIPSPGDHLSLVSFKA